MNKYFKLNPFVIFKQDDNEGCLYNLSNGNMFNVKENMYDILKKVENNISIDELNNEEVCFLDKLESMGLGKYYDNNVYIDNTYLGESIEFENIIEKNIEINRIYLELTNKCNLNCVFCNPLDDKAYKKTGCKRWSNKEEPIGIDDYKEILNQCLNLGLKEIVFTGGEPFLEFEKIKKIVEYSERLGINKFIIYTNGIILSNEMIKFIKKFNIRLIIQVLSLDDKEFLLLTGKNLNISILNVINELKLNNIDFFIKILVNKVNENSIEKIKSQLYEYGLKGKIILDYIYPHNKEYNSLKYEEQIYNKKLKLTNVSLANYTINRKYNKCFYNQLAITLDGYVIPCIMLRKIKLGSIKQKPIYKIITEEKYCNIIRLNKSKIDKCSRCSYNLGCSDCLAIQYEATGNLETIEYCK